MSPLAPSSNLLGSSKQYFDIVADDTFDIWWDNLATQEYSHRWPAEKHLQHAVLEDALHILFRYHGSKQRRGMRLYNEIKEWIETESDDKSVFSFMGICESLNLDSGYVIKGIQKSLDSNQAPNLKRKRIRNSFTNLR